MASSIEIIKAEALQLSAAERARLIERLSASLEELEKEGFFKKLWQ